MRPPPPPSPSLIDFTVHHPRPTLLDQDDEYGFPSPQPITEPYKDNFSDESDQESGGEDRDGRSEGEKEVERLLDVVPAQRRHSKKGQSQKNLTARRSGGKPAQAKRVVPEQGTISVTLPDGSIIAFRPPQASGSASLGQPGIASGFQEALQLIQQLALGAPLQKPKLSTVDAESTAVKPKAVKVAKKRPLQQSTPGLLRSSTSPWPILASAKKPSGLAPTARPFQPSFAVIAPSPSTSPSPPLSNSTLDEHLIPSSRTSSPDPGHPPGATLTGSTVLNGPSSAGEPIAISTPAEIAQLFKCDITPVPYIECDFPYNQPSRKKRKPNTVAPPVLQQRPAPPPKSPGAYERQLQDVLSKFGASSRAPLAAKALNPGASAWTQPQPSSVESPDRHLSSILVDIGTEPLSGSLSVPEYYDPPHTGTSLELEPLSFYDLDSLGICDVDEMTGTPSYEWQRDINPSIGSRDVRGTSSYTYHRHNGNGPAVSGRAKEQISEYSDSPYHRLLAMPSARETVPRHHKISTDALQASIMASWIAAEPSDDKKRYVLKLATKLTRFVQTEFGGYDGDDGSRYVVDVFGSVSWGGETGKGGDIDMVIRDTHYPQGYHPSLWLEGDQEPKSTAKYDRNRPQIVRSDLPPIYDLKNVVSLLRRRGFADVFGIYGATTPIAKFRDPYRAGIEADVNVNDLGGWYNSRLILAYCEISPHVLRPLIHALKLWSKANHINDPSGRNGTPTMSSYCLTLMAIGFLQHCQVLPNLQEDVEVSIPDTPEKEGSDVIWAGWGRKTGTKINVGFHKTAPPGWTPAVVTVSQAIRGFFAFFARHGTSEGFRYDAEIVSILNGGVIERSKPQGQETQEAQQRKLAGLPPLSKDDLLAKENMMGKGNIGIQPRNWGERRLVVQDPFIWQKNCTQSMSKAGLDRWLNAVDHSNDLFERYGDRCTLEDLLGNCLPPPPGPLIGGTQQPSPLRGRGGHRGRGRGSPFGRSLFAA